MPYEDDYKIWLEKMLIESNPDWICDGMYDVGLTNEWCDKHCGEDSDYVTPKCLHMFYHHIARADRKRGRVMKWILCDERLPDDNREVLISLEWGIDIGTYERGEWRSEWINHYDDDNVLAWMPLPKPYKADRKTEPQTERSE